eukprot:gene2435-389_t
MGDGRPRAGRPPAAAAAAAVAAVAAAVVVLVEKRCQEAVKEATDKLDATFAEDDKALWASGG